MTTEPKLDSIVKTASGMLKSRKGIEVVKINSHRADKTLKFNSVDVIRKMIKGIEKLGLEADTKSYDTLLNINITKDVAYVSLDKEKGLGGLPVGSSGKGVVLLSGESLAGCRMVRNEEGRRANLRAPARPPKRG